MGEIYEQNIAALVETGICYQTTTEITEQATEEKAVGRQSFRHVASAKYRDTFLAAPYAGFSVKALKGETAQRQIWMFCTVQPGRCCTDLWTTVDSHSATSRRHPLATHPTFIPSHPVSFAFASPNTAISFPLASTTQICLPVITQVVKRGKGVAPNATRSKSATTKAVPQNKEREVRTH
ncbi:hypothetical protein TRVL_00835 [Trypanosoma vivax]|uniref:Uncharacterized protein n=1 Tax=Trypanosoma vivax (strain Y486) TaxID=1055687 RepID=G0TY53_TRYVY|nr:hypothetical protein TRVL_00835 [Trypanosoma vivax]CCC48898.1 hypothetical protein, unlikely [Trypanosoma vivax Y486]